MAGGRGLADVLKSHANSSLSSFGFSCAAARQYPTNILSLKFLSFLLFILLLWPELFAPGQLCGALISTASARKRKAQYLFRKLSFPLPPNLRIWALKSAIQNNTGQFQYPMAYHRLGDNAHADNESKASISFEDRRSPHHDKHETFYEHCGTQYEPKRRVLQLGTAFGFIICVIFGLFSFAAVTGLFVSDANKGIIPGRISLGTCGKSPEEARTKGCVFDLFIGSFMHPQCFDESLHDRYMREHSWIFYVDPEGINEIPVEQVLAGEFEEIWMDGTFHYTHCAYVWEKHWRALESGGGIVAMDTRARNGHHNMHCIDFIGAPNSTYVAGRVSSHIHQRFGLVDCVVGPM